MEESLESMSIDERRRIALYQENAKMNKIYEQIISEKRPKVNYAVSASEIISKESLEFDEEPMSDTDEFDAHFYTLNPGIVKTQKHFLKQQRDNELGNEHP